MMLRKALLTSLLTASSMLVVAGSAAAWTNPGNYTLNGSLTFPMQSGGLPGGGVVTCGTASLTTALDNTYTYRDMGTVTAASLTCTTTQPNCAVTANTSALPWVLADAVPSSNNSVQVSYVQFTVTFTGAACTFQNIGMTIEGNAIADVSYPTTGCTGQQRTRLTFNNSPGLVVASTTVTGTLPPGRGTAVRVSGSVETGCLGSSLNPEMVV